MPGSTAGNNTFQDFTTVVSLLLIASNESKWYPFRRPLGTLKSDKASNQLSTVDISTLLSVSWSKITLLKVLSGKAHCHNSKSTRLAKDLVFFNKYIEVNSPRLEGLLVL